MIGVIGFALWLGVVVLFLWLYGRILMRAGFSGWWALLALIPLVNLVMLWVFAFIDWPALGPPRVGGEANRIPPPQ